MVNRYDSAPQWRNALWWWKQPVLLDTTAPPNTTGCFHHQRAFSHWGALLSPSTTSGRGRGATKTAFLGGQLWHHVFAVDKCPPLYYSWHFSIKDLSCWEWASLICVIVCKPLNISRYKRGGYQANSLYLYLPLKPQNEYCTCSYTSNLALIG